MGIDRLAAGRQPVLFDGRRLDWLLAAAASFCVLLIYAPTVLSAVMVRDGQGTDLELGVAVLAPLAAAWLLWNSRQRLDRIDVHAWWPGLLGVAAAAAAWALADLVNINLLRQLALVAMLPAVVATVLGSAFARALAFPFLFLLFAVNLFFPLTVPLMHLTATASVQALRLAGAPVVV